MMRPLQRGLLMIPVVIPGMSSHMTCKLWLMWMIQAVAQNRKFSESVQRRRVKVF